MCWSIRRVDSVDQSSLGCGGRECAVLADSSGHYKHDSLNVQAMSDHRGKFLYFAVAASGSFPDASALALTRLQQQIHVLPHGFYVIADNDT